MITLASWPQHTIEVLGARCQYEAIGLRHKGGQHEQLIQQTE